MNHTIIKDLPYIGRVYNRSRYIDRLYTSTNPTEVQFVLYHGMKNGFLDATDILHIYVNADSRVVDEDIQVADWIMTELGPIVSEPGPIHLPNLPLPFTGLEFN